MKCPNCPRITSKETDAEPEGDLTVDDAGTVTGDIRIFNTCAECGSELEQAEFSAEIDLTAEAADHFKEKHGGEAQALSVSAEITRTDETQAKDRNGKPIKSSRYMKRFYGVEANVALTCDECGEEFANGTFADRVQASGMEWIA